MPPFFKGRRAGRILIGLSLGIGTNAALLSPATAGLEICNDVRGDVTMAYGYKEGGQWVARGWYTVQPETCYEVISGDLQNRYYYFYAEHVDTNNKWSGSTIFCTNHRRGFKRTSHRVCNGKDWEKTGYRTIDTGEYSDYKYYLRYNNAD